MAKFTSGFGVLLSVVGIMGYLWTKDLQPFAFGVALVICGVLANSEERRRRMIWMHIAVLLGFISFALTGYIAARAVLHVHRHGGKIEWVQMQNFQEVVALLSLFFVLVCVGSFVLARRSPAATPKLAEA